MSSPHGSTLVVRDERADDLQAIRDLHVQAFGQDQEARIVDALRSNGAVLSSLVAAEGDRILGHILYSPATIGALAGAALGPMAVLPACQRQGVGARLIAEGTRRLKAAGCPFVIVVGHPDYYPRFGFTPPGSRGITCEWDVPADVFMVQVLDDARMQGVSGLAKYREEFSSVS